MLAQAVANPYASATVDVLAGDGNGGFAVPQSFTVFDTPVALAPADYNADGKPDIALSNTSGLLGVLINTRCLGRLRPVAWATAAARAWSRSMS